MSTPQRVVVVVDRDPFASNKNHWARILGVLDYDEITLDWPTDSRQTVHKYCKWNMVVCLLDPLQKRVYPIALCNGDQLIRRIVTFVSISATQLSKEGFVHLNGTYRTELHNNHLDYQDDTIREVLGGRLRSLTLTESGEIIATARCQFLREIIRGNDLSVASMHRTVSRLVRSHEDLDRKSEKAPKVVRTKNRTNKHIIRSELYEERKARLAEFRRIYDLKTYFFDRLNEIEPATVVAPFTCLTFTSILDNLYANQRARLGYLKTVTRYADGQPPWDRVFVQEWATLGIETPPKNARMVVLQYPNANGKGYSFAVCDAARLQSLIDTTNRPTFSEVYREDMFVTAIPVDWDMPVDKVLGSTWCPTTWLTRIQCAADKALRRLLPCLNVSTQKQGIVKPVMWLSEEMMANLLPNDSISIAGLKKITVHANLLIPCNVVVWNHKVLQTVYEEMERQDGERTTWYLDKFITKLRLPGCFKRLDDGSHVRRLVPWKNAHDDARVALVHARHGTEPWEGIDVAILRTLPSKTKFYREKHFGATGIQNGEVDLSKALDILYRIFSQKPETASLKLMPKSQKPIIAVQKGPKETNWCIIKGGVHTNATMYLVIDKKRAWIHCYSARCQKKRDNSYPKPFIDLSDASIQLPAFS